MYSWKTIRSIAAVLLIIPILHLAYLISREMLLVLDASPEAWAEEVKRYAKIDQGQTLPEDPVLLIGGRRVTLWTELDTLIAPKPMLKRSLGDATVTDISYYYQQLIGFYRPQTVVFLPGESEFHLRDNKSAEEFVTAVRELVEKDLSYDTTQHFYVIAPLKTPLYRSNYPKIDDITRRLTQWADKHEEVEILNANLLLTTRQGEANPIYFRSDGVNLNDRGYMRLSLLLRQQLERDYPSVYTPPAAL